MVKLTPLIEGEDNFRYDEGYEDAGYSTVSPEEDGELFDVFEDSEDEEDNSEMDLPENDDYEVLYLPQ